MIRVFSIPLRTRFRGITVREGVLVEGPAGLGGVEPVPRVRRPDRATVAACRRGGRRRGLARPAARRRARQRHGARVQPRARPRDRAAPAAARTAKVKVAEAGQTLGDDEARLEAVRDALGPGGLIRVDANGGWDVDEAVGAIRLLERAAGGLEYVEQPCAERRGAGRRTPRGRRADRRRRVDPPGRGPLPGARPGGRRHRRAQGAAARAACAPACGSPRTSACRSWSPAPSSRSVGIAAGVALAAALPELPHACGLATVQLLTDDVVTEPLLPVDGMLPVRTPGRRPRRARPAGRRPGAGRLVGAPAGRSRAAGSALVNPLDRPGPRRRHRAARGRGARGRALPRARATRRCPSPSTTRPGPGCCGCTPGSTSAPPASSRSGLTKVGARAAVVCTSGTAVANLLPAVMEAAHAGVDLVVVTADRPARMRGTGANQTTDQVGVFGAFAPTTVLEPSGPAVGVVLSAPAARSTSTSSSTSRCSPTDRWTDVGRRLLAPRRGDDRAEPVELPAGPRTVVVAGDDAGPPARVLAQDAGWPLLAEPTQRLAHRRPRRSAPTACCWAATSATASSGSSSPATRRCPARSPGCSAARTSRSSRCASRGIWPARPFAGRPGGRPASPRRARRPRLARGVARGRPVGGPPARPAAGRRARPHAVRGRRRGQPGAAARGAAARRRLQPDPRPRPDGGAATPSATGAR